MNILKNFPARDEILEWYSKQPQEDYYLVNGHLHTPYSFSAFSQVSELFDYARQEDIKVIGINDFNAADGYDEFYRFSAEQKRFPLFNIEFMGLIKEEQQAGVRINDPNNPGRIYFSGKGLDYPFHTKFINRRRLSALRRESQLQVKDMIAKVNGILKEMNAGTEFSYETVKSDYARNLVRERHIAKALRIFMESKYNTEKERKDFLKALYGGKESKAALTNPAQLENELRGNLLKSGGRAFVEENQKAFLDLSKIISIIRNAGGIPCYPVLLDDKNGNFTEFESNPEALLSKLEGENIHCLELIPGRNDLNILEKFVQFFYEHRFIITFGTEHNSPGMIPLRISARGNVALNDHLNRINYEGACIIAAHQYLRVQGQQGFINKNGTWALDKKDEYAKLGRAVINYFIK